MIEDDKSEMVQDAQHNEQSNEYKQDANTAANYLSEDIVATVKSETGRPNGWQTGDESDCAFVTGTYPSRNQRSGGIALMEWVFQDANQDILCTIWLDSDSDGYHFQIELAVEWGLYHGHTAETLEAAIETASAMMYMATHFEHEKEQWKQDQREAERTRKGVVVAEILDEVERIGGEKFRQACGKWYEEGHAGDVRDVADVEGLELVSENATAIAKAAVIEIVTHYEEYVDDFAEDTDGGEA